MKKRIIYGVVQLLVISILLLLAFSLGRSAALNEPQSVGFRKNSIGCVDTILGRKYIVAVDTVTGEAEIMGFRHTPEMLEDSLFYDSIY